MSVELFDGRVMAAYAQVGIADAEDPDSYPQWDQQTALGAFVTGERGIAVSAALDADVDVRVLGSWKGDDLKEGEIVEEHLLTSVQITVGNRGVWVGNVTMDFARLWWPPGPTRVTVYVNAPPEDVTAVTFVLEQI